MKPTTISEHFSALVDPRVDRTKRHSLTDVLAITICGVVCGADDWVAIQAFAEEKLDWFKTFLDLPNGVPSHDTLGHVFAALDPDAFSEGFSAWVASMAEVTEGEVVAIDGKTLRQSVDRASSEAAIHMVSAWASCNRLVLGHVTTAEKSNEITAIPRLLEALPIDWKQPLSVDHTLSDEVRGHALRDPTRNLQSADRLDRTDLACSRPPRSPRRLYLSSVAWGDHAPSSRDDQDDRFRRDISTLQTDRRSDTSSGVGDGAGTKTNSAPRSTSAASSAST